VSEKSLNASSGIAWAAWHAMNAMTAIAQTDVTFIDSLVLRLLVDDTAFKQ
jgi:hypothetical protein